MSSNKQISAKAGLAIYHMNQPEQLFDSEDLHMRLSAHAEVTMGIKGTRLAVAPSVLYLSQGPLKQINIGGLLKYSLEVPSSKN